MSDKAELERRLLREIDEWRNAGTGPIDGIFEAERNVMRAALALADAIREQEDGDEG